MVTVGVVTAIAIAAGHVGLASIVWPGERVMPEGIEPDPALRLRAAALEVVADAARHEADGLRDALKRATEHRKGAEAQTEAARGEVRSLEAERAVLRKEVKRLTRAAVLAAAECGIEERDG